MSEHVILTTITGIERVAFVHLGLCEQLIELFRDDGRVERCTADATGLAVRDIPVRRSLVAACYCTAHGGRTRAERELAAAWPVAAPDSVGDDESVNHAGALQLRTPEAYVEIRQLAADIGGKWLAFLGLGSLQTPVENPRAALKTSRNGTVRLSKSGKPRGAYSFASREEAEAAAIEAWRVGLARRVAKITEARGGTLAWGTAIEPLDRPHVIVLEPGMGTAWDVAVTLPRVAPVGLAVMSGLRASGEVA